MQVERKLPDAEQVLEVLAARFVHDPEFIIKVNGRSLAFHEIEGKVAEKRIEIDASHSANVIVIDSTRINHSAVHQGIAFWVQRRLVGSPSWTVGQVGSFDGRTRFARRYNVIVDTEGFESEVQGDWTAFQDTESVRRLHAMSFSQIASVAGDLAAEVVEESSTDALLQNRSELVTLGRGARIGVAEFTKSIAQAHPTMSPEFLAAAVKAVIHLEKSKSGVSLLQKLSTIEPDDLDALDRVLAEWTVKDALRVLDEIEKRINVIEAVSRLADDATADELHTLHPLILRARWLFGPEFESEEFCSNATLQTIAKRMFHRTDAKFANDRSRPDILILPDRTSLQLTGIQSFDPSDSTIIGMQHVLLIELKRGGFELTRKEVNQAEGYVEDIVAAGVFSGAPFVSAWVVGQTIAPAVPKDKTLRGDAGDTYGRVRATTFAALVDTASWRLLKLRELLASRYSSIPTDSLLQRVMSTPEQTRIDVTAMQVRK